MSTYGMTVTVLATQLADAVAKDEAPEEGGFDLSAGMFGKSVSDWIRAVAKELDDRASEIDRLKQAHASSLAGAWRVVHDGDSLAMLQHPDGRIFCLQQLGKGRSTTWGNADDNDDLCKALEQATIAEGQLQKERRYSDTLAGLVLKMIDRWWPFVHGAPMASTFAKDLRKEASDALTRTEVQGESANSATHENRKEKV